MRAVDIHTTVSIDEEKRLILLTGAIDDVGYVINMRIPVPIEGEWTIIKAETNLSADPWATWQMVFDNNVELVLKDGKPDVLYSRNFEHARYIPSKNIVVFFGGEPVRPGETVLKTFKVKTKVKEILASHASRTKPRSPEYYKVIAGEITNSHLPRFEMDPVVQKISLPEIFENKDERDII